MKISSSIACCCACVILSGCSVFSSKEITVSRDDSVKQQREYFRNELINHDGLALESENFLRGNLMQDDLTSNPQLVLKKLNEYYKISGNPKFLIIAADLCRYLATQTDDPDSIRYNLSSFYYCTFFAREQRKNKDKNSEASSGYESSLTQSLQDYNEACCGIFSFLKKRNLLDADSITLRDAEGHNFVLAKPEFHLSIPREAVEEFSLCASYTIQDLMQINRQPGIGIPLVAKIKIKKWYSSLKTPDGLTIPVTLLLERKDSDSDNIILRLVFVDTSKRETFQTKIEDSKSFDFPMALDFSTPLAVFLNGTQQRNLLTQMLNAFEQEARDGLYMIEPYQPDKIPVVFIHGLMSSPETWVQMINSLKNDPTIRKRYQFWFFSYSTGAPVVYSASKLRTALLAAQKEFCTTPETTANFNKMVLVGHSMGGMLTRLMVQQNPYAIFENISGNSWEQIQKKLTPEDFKYLNNYVPYSLPFVHRVVFMAVPHRGANMAQSWIARLGISLIKLPASLLSKEATIKRIVMTLQPQFLDRMKDGLYTGIDNLNPENAFVKAIGSSKMKDDLIYHCVIGNKSEEGVPGNSDGVVPYWSSHLDNAASELVVKSDHSVHRRPMAIQELLRILLLHLNNTDNK